MYFERYLLRTTDNDLDEVFDESNINNTLYTSKTISDETLDIYNEEPLKYDAEYASFQHIIATYTKPSLIGTSERFKLFKFKILYAKTSDNQAIVRVSDWDQVDNLTSSEGPAYTLNVFCVLYGNSIKFAFEYQYHALPSIVVYKLLKNITQDCFLNTEILEDVHNSEDFELCMDINETDYEEIFDSSNRSKQIVLYMDSNTERGEVINSGKILLSVKTSSSFQSTLTVANNKLRGRGIARYVIKCQDSDGRIATLQNNDNTNNWQQPARTEIELESTSYKTELFTFLRN